jgi:hypothetical protein
VGEQDVGNRKTERKREDKNFSRAAHQPGKPELHNSGKRAKGLELKGKMLKAKRLKGGYFTNVAVADARLECAVGDLYLSRQCALHLVVDWAIEVLVVSARVISHRRDLCTK